MAGAYPPLVMEIVTDPDDLARARAQREQFDRNAAWLQAHAHEVYAYSQCRGKCICVAGAERFAADTPEAAVALAIAAHPEDDGWFVRYIPKDKVPRIYADLGRVVPMR